MLLLVQFQILGEISNNLLSEVRSQLGVNQTKLMVCLHMTTAGKKIKSKNSVTPTEIARLMCCPVTRVINQLAELIRSKLVVKVNSQNRKNLNLEPVDFREQRYVLTAAGLKLVVNFMELATQSEKQLSALIPAKTEAAFLDLQDKLKSAIEAGSLSNLKTLDAALRSGKLQHIRKNYIHIPKLKKLNLSPAN